MLCGNLEGFIAIGHAFSALKNIVIRLRSTMKLTGGFVTSEKRNFLRQRTTELDIRIHTYIKMEDGAKQTKM